MTNHGILLLGHMPLSMGWILIHDPCWWVSGVSTPFNYRVTLKLFTFWRNICSPPQGQCCVCGLFILWVGLVIPNVLIKKWEPWKPWWVKLKKKDTYEGFEIFLGFENCFEPQLLKFQPRFPSSTIFHSYGSIRLPVERTFGNFGPTPPRGRSYGVSPVSRSISATSAQTSVVKKIC